MPEIKHQQLDASPEILSAEIHIPDDKDLGTGTFTINLAPKALTPAKVISSAMVNRPNFQISVTVNPNGNVAVMLGRTNPLDSAIFRLPQDVKRGPAHTLTIQFTAWHIFSASLDDAPLTKADEVTH